MIGGRRRTGFTLTELIVVAAITTVLLVALAGAVGGGLMAWRKAEVWLQMVRDGTKAVQLLEDQLVRSLASETFPFHGDRAGLEFVMTDGVGPVQVRWTSVAASDESGSLTSSWWSLKPEGATGVQRLQVCPWVRQVSFTYPVGRQTPPGYTWQDLWPAANAAQAPQAVRVELHLTGPRGATWDLERIIVLPHGVFGAETPGPP